MSTGNVGIGTTSPNYKLDVAGSANAAQLCIAGDCKTSWSQAGGGAWAISGADIYNTNTGNVGIGVAIPTAKFTNSIATSGYALDVVPSSSYGAQQGGIHVNLKDYDVDEG